MPTPREAVRDYVSDIVSVMVQLLVIWCAVSLLRWWFGDTSPEDWARDIAIYTLFSLERRR